MGKAPSTMKASDEGCRGIYFQRDAAGLSNLRMQLESLMAICKVCKRFLVLPPPTTIHHLDEAFHESHFWSMTHLARHVPIVLATEVLPPREVHEVSSQLAFCSLEDLPKDQHWYFPSAVSRIQHFEALPWRNDVDRSDAALCVFESFELASCHHRVAERLLRLANLKKHAYAAVHLRRGDFQTFRPKGHRSAEDIARSLGPHIRDRVVVVATDAADDDSEVRKLRQQNLPGALGTVFLSSLHDAGDDALTRAAVEMLVCRWGEPFVGTHESTFTNGIFALRLKDAKTEKRGLEHAPILLFGQEPKFAVGCRGVCWDRLTEFRALP